jgi:peptidoglycan/LPS O-acetylase OafA/YrhL
MQFRKDINGLRAIAVIAVVLFHFNASWMPGGFAGVDVFFVISGYLMTGIIFRGIEQENFSIFRFYVSRANRIIPALAVLCLAILVLGYFFLTSWDYKTIGRDVATSMSFVSNIMFSLRRGYFDTGDNFLLHTWTLSTEWQFYIIYPLVLVVMRKFMSVKTMKKIVLFGMILGFIFGAIATYKWPTPSYYLLPMRAWEMMIGGVAYLYPFTVRDKDKRLFEWGGVALIVGSYFLISKENPWPGYLAMLPVFGAFLIIQSQRNDSIVTSNTVFQKIGVWSYSIYLWHWPIAVSFSYYAIDEKYKIIGIVLSIFLGFLSYYLIENKSRNVLSPIKVSLKYLVIVVFFGVAGSFIYKTQGIAERESLVSNSLIPGGTMDDHLIHEGMSLLNTEGEYDYLLIGDSNSNHYVRGIMHSGSRVKLSWYATCLSFPNSVSTRNGAYLTWKEDCSNNYKLGLSENAAIIIAQSWNRSQKDSLECKNEKCQLTGAYSTDLKSQLAELFKVYGNSKHIYVVGEVPKSKNNEIMTCLKTNTLLGLGLNCAEKGKHKESVNKINIILNDATSDYKNVTFIDPVKALCINGLCNYSVNGKSIFMPDGGHFSGYGSEVMWDYIINKIKGFN